MSRCRLSVLVVVVLCLAAFSHAQPVEPSDPPLVNWTAPPYWTPPTGQHLARPQAPSAQASSTERDVSLESTPETPLTGSLPFVAVTPCRLVDTRHAPYKDLKQPGGGTPSGYPRGTYASGEIRSYDLTSSTDCTDLPAGVGAWSLQFQFTTATQAAYLEAWPYSSGGGIGGQTAPAKESTMLGYTDRWTANSAIIPAGDDANGSINVFVQYVGDVIVEVNGYYGPQGVVNSVAGLSGVVGMTGGTGITVTTGSNAVTITHTGGSGGLLPSATTNYTLRGNGTSWVASGVLTNDGSSNVGVSGNLNLPATSGSSAGVITLGTYPFIHGYWSGTGSPNTFVGGHAGNFSSTGAFDTAVGSNSLFSNTTGDHNTAIGSSSLYSNTTGQNNSASGFASLAFNTKGSSNTASGSSSLSANTEGSNNTASGYLSLGDNTVGSDNSAIGYDSLLNNTTGSKNTAVGSQALYTQSYNPPSNNPWDSLNTAVGYQALYSDQPDNTIDGVYNTALGAQSLYSNTTGAYNTASGYQSLYSNTTGNYNTASGSSSLQANATGWNNTAIGVSSLRYNTTASENAAVGTGALESQSYDNSGTM